MTHKYSLSISILSIYTMELRDSAIYVLKRVIEDYFKATEFIHQLLNEIAKFFNIH